jgi:hypothetical protein
MPGVFNPSFFRELQRSLLIIPIALSFDSVI